MNNENNSAKGGAARPFRLSAETLRLAHGENLYTVAEVLSTDWQCLPAGAFVFLSKAIRGSSYYCTREKGVLLPILPGPVMSGRIARNELLNDGPLVLGSQQGRASEPEEVGYVKTSIYRLYYPLSAEPLPKL